MLSNGHFHWISWCVIFFWSVGIWWISPNFKTTCCKESNSCQCSPGGGSGASSSSKPAGSPSGVDHLNHRLRDCSIYTANICVENDGEWILYGMATWSQIYIYIYIYTGEKAAGKGIHTWEIFQLESCNLVKNRLRTTSVIASATLEACGMRMHASHKPVGFL